MLSFIKRNLLSALFLMIIVATALSIFFNEQKCPIQNGCYFSSDSVLYTLATGEKYFFVGIKVFCMLVAIATVWLVSREIKDGGFIPYATSLIAFAALVCKLSVVADTEILSLFLLFSILFTGKRYLKNPCFFYAFGVSLLMLVAVAVDFRNLLFCFTVLVVLFFTDDVFQIIHPKKLFAIKPLLGLIVGLLPLPMLFHSGTVERWRIYTDGFSMDFSGYLFAEMFYYPWRRFDGIAILSIFIPTFFVLCGVYALIKAEFRNVINHVKEAELSTVDDIVYYIAVYFPIVYVIVMSSLLKQKVSPVFFYPLLLSLPFLIKKGLMEALPFFNEEKERHFIAVIAVFVSLMFVIVGVLSGTNSLHNVTEAKVTVLASDFIKSHPGKYMTSKYKNVFNYVTQTKNFSYVYRAVSSINQKDFWKGYDYYIPSKVKKDGECYVVKEPNESQRIFNYSQFRVWICSKPDFNYKDKLYIFKIDDIKLR